MTTLNDQELNCLRKIANGQSSDILPACADHTLKRLVSLGLLEYSPATRLPLEMMQHTHRLTSAGFDALKQS
jgi:hypothetical protein